MNAANKRAGEFYTPYSIIRLTATILDSARWIGGMLLGIKILRGFTGKN
ncbi:MAG: hypothetical protein KJZ77_13040 [Anaerolineales bacterium]|nr:hypothetical protein [Anaerolineales bacterium]